MDKLKLRWASITGCANRCPMIFHTVLTVSFTLTDTQNFINLHLGFSEYWLELRLHLVKDGQ